MFRVNPAPKESSIELQNYLKIGDKPSGDKKLRSHQSTSRIINQREAKVRLRKSRNYLPNQRVYSYVLPAQEPIPGEAATQYSKFDGEVVQKLANNQTHGS